MQKIIIALVALTACVLAGSITPDYQCAMHYRMNVTLKSGGEVYTVVTDDKMMYNGNMLYAYSNTLQFLNYTDFSMASYERCDIKQGELCYGNLIVKSGGTEEVQDHYRFFEQPQVTVTWVYEDGPTDVKCPYNSITECKQYCNSTRDECVIFDSEQHFIQYIQKVGNMTSIVTVNYYKDIVKVEDFVGTYENGTKMSVPHDICSIGSSSASLTKAALLVVVIAALIVLF